MDSNTGTMRIMDRSGDKKEMWDKSKPEEVECARNTFDRLRKSGYLAYKVDQAGGKAEQLHEFDAAVETMIMSPPIVGG